MVQFQVPTIIYRSHITPCIGGTPRVHASGVCDCMRLLLRVSWLVIRVNAHIPPLIEPGKEVFHHGVVDGS